MNWMQQNYRFEEFSLPEKIMICIEIILFISLIVIVVYHVVLS